MEGIERYSSEVHDRRIEMMPYMEMAGRARTLDPKDLILPEGADMDRLIPWVEGYDIANDQPIIVPAHAVFHPLPQRYPRSSAPQRTGSPREILSRRRSSTHSRK